MPEVEVYLRDKDMTDTFLIDSAEDVNREGQEYTIHTEDGRILSYPMDVVEAIEMKDAA